MDQTPLHCIDEFEQEKFLSLYDSLSLSPISKPASPFQPSPFQPSPGENGFPNKREKSEMHLQVPKVGRHRRSSTEEDKNVNRGHWLLDENKKYHWFLEIHYKHFVNRHMRRMDKIFKTMETFIGTRQAEQCRSHHQKMEKKYRNFITIIINLRLQHYGNEDIGPIAEDITASGLALLGPLATIALLNQEEAMPLICVTDMKERCKICTPKYEEIQIDSLLNLAIEEEKEANPEQEVPEPAEVMEGPEMQFHSMNMLEESNLNIGELLLYHEKEENSCLFNFQ